MPDINAGAISEALNNKVDIGYGNTSPKQPVTRQQITNCILEDPQNIKLELSNGTLTLKAGSVVIVPNGFESDGMTLKFDEVYIESDVTNTGIPTGTTLSNAIILYDIVNNAMELWDRTNVISGTSVTAQYTMLYNTSTNIIKRTNDTGATFINQYAFPIAIAEFNGTTITSIDQTFQSIGYIGSTAFARKGLKVLIPNGRNDDGSLNNIEYTTDNVLTRTFPSSGTKYYYLQISPYRLDTQISAPESYDYNEVLNIHADNIGTDIGQCSATNGVISSFKPYTATNILKYSDKSQVSAFPMPGSKYIDLTLGASGTTYTAPANGYFTVGFTGTNGDSYFELVNNTIFDNKLSSSASFVSGWARCFIPVMKGDVMSVYYGGTNFTLRFFRFVYMQGETSS